MISLILPTVRPRKMMECLNAIVRASNGVAVEVVIVSDFKLDEAASFVELEPLKHMIGLKNIVSERRGVVDANIKGYEASEGDYVMTLSDEALLQPGSLERLTQFCKQHHDKVLTSPRHVPYYGFYYYQKWFAPFPFAHKSLIEDIGGLFLPEYKCFYADPDLSLRAYAKGYEVAECHDAVIIHTNMMNDTAHQNNVASYVVDDRRTFKEKWAHLGEFKDP